MTEPLDNQTGQPGQDDQDQGDDNANNRDESGENSEGLLSITQKHLDEIVAGRVGETKVSVTRSIEEQLGAPLEDVAAIIKAVNKKREAEND